MIFRKFLIFGIVFCLTLALKVQGEDLSGQFENSSAIKVIKESDVVKEANEQEVIELANTTESSEKPNESEVTVKPAEMEIKTDQDETTDSAKDTPNVLNVMEMLLNDEDKVMLQNLNGIIEKVPEMNNTQVNREGKSFKDENLKRAAEALTDDEITEIIKSISFPHDDEISEDSESLKPASETEVEPRTSRMGKALKSHGYYVIAFTPIAEENDNNLHDTLPYTRLQILPAERAMNGDASTNPRMISKKTWNRYIRRIMRQIRKGTRKIQRKTKVKTLKEEPTVENFLKRMYKISQDKRLKQQQTKKKSSWFIW